MMPEKRTFPPFRPLPRSANGGFLDNPARPPGYVLACSEVSRLMLIFLCSGNVNKLTQLRHLRYERCAQ
jgi:hypothetical protein